MAYANTYQVAALCRNILGSADQFGTSTSPTIVEVQDFLTSGCMIINTHLNSWGYDAPPASTTSLYGMLSELNTLYAAGRAEMTRSNVVLGPGERTRGQVFLGEFWAALKLLSSMELTGAGGTKPGAGTTPGAGAGAFLYVGGISYADKSRVESDTDRVKPRFERDMFRFEGTVSPQDEDED